MSDSFHVTQNKTLIDNNADSYPFLQSKQGFHASLESNNIPQNLSLCDQQAIHKHQRIVRPLPSIEGIITNSASQGSFESERGPNADLYNFVDGSNPPSNTKHSEMQSSSSSLSLSWEKPKQVQDPPTTSNTTYGMVSHVLEQHFGFKEESELLEAIDMHEKDASNSDLTLCSSTAEPQVILAEKDSSLPDNDDSDATSSSESFSVIDPNDFNFQNEDKSMFVECTECESYLRNKRSFKVHMRLHTGVRPYTCNECGESFHSCGLLLEHGTQHGASSDKPFSCNECFKSFNCEKHFKLHRRKHVAPKMFNCSECKQSFATKDRLIRHSRAHFGEITYFCDKCGQFFANKLRFDEHKLTHRHNTWKCEDCENCTYENPQQLEKHIVSVHDIPKTSDDIMQPIQLTASQDSNRFACEICSVKFEKISEYYIHRCNHKPIKTYKCDLCNAAFFKEFQLFVHSAAHKITFECDVCQTHFKTKKALKYHIQKNNHNLPFLCSHCDLSFKEEDDLNSHMKTHCGDKPFSCDQCQATFRHSSTLKIHRRIHSGETPFVCSICRASFIQSQHLQIHLRSHSGNKPYKCNDCNASFTKKDYLFAHRTKHGNDTNLTTAAIISENSMDSGVNNLRCTYCEMTFSHQSTLAAHLRKHTGERPFVCDKCSASFLYSSNLTTHRRKHTGERPYKCKECDASFTLKSYLTMHLRKHSGERPFKCDICESSFTQKTHLSTHRRIHTGEYPYKCDICGDAFRDGANFWRHKKRHADDVQTTSGNSEGRYSRTKVKRLRARNTTGSKIVPSTPSYIPHEFLEEVAEVNGDSLINNSENPFDHALATVKSENG